MQKKFLFAGNLLRVMSDKVSDEVPARGPLTKFVSGGLTNFDSPAHKRQVGNSATEILKVAVPASTISASRSL
jgi:hypothetical protein